MSDVAPEEDGVAFSISHESDGTFLLQIHASSPAELDPVSARQLRAVLTGLAREIGKTIDGSASSGGIRTPQRTSPGPREAAS